MKIYSYGLILGLVLATLIFLSNVVFPNNGPDEAPLMLIPVLLITVAIIWSANHATKGSKDKNVALKVGMLTSLIGFSIAVITFIIIDNGFLSIVSQQSDKIWGFHHSNFSSMQAYINAGLLRQVLIGIPASAMFGLICGLIGNKIPHKIG